MVISRKKKFIFVHNPKTGGSSLFESARPYGYRFSNKSEKIQGYTRKFLKESYSLGLFRKHIPAWDLKNKMPYDEWESYFKFGFVRNPYDRVVSLYNYMQQLPIKRRPQNFIDYKSLEDYIDDLLTRDLGEEPWHCQYYYLTDLRGDIIVDFVGRFENLSEDFSQICKQVHISDKNLIHINKSQRERDLNKLLSPEFIEKINIIFKDDFEIFNYEMLKAPSKI